MRTVTSAMVAAQIPSDRVLRGAVADLVIAVALVRELDASQRKALRRTEVRAERARHVRARGRRASERAAVRTLRDAPDLVPAVRQRGLRSDERGRGRVSARAGGPCPGAVPEGVAARELGDGRVEADVLVDVLGLEHTRVGRGLVEDGGERGAVHNVTLSLRARVDGLLEKIDVPAILEVAVVAVPGGVPIRKDPGAVAPVGVLVDRDEHLVEE